MAKTQIENENTFKKALSDGINLFIGAGFSVLAKDKNGKAMPAGDTLKDELLAAFSQETLSSLDLPKIASILEHSNKELFYRFLRERFSVKSHSEKYEVIGKINVKNIFTTNIDNLFFEIYSKSASHYINDLDMRGPAYNDLSAVEYVALHGSVLDENRPLVFRNIDIAAAFRSDPDRWHSLTGKLQERPTLFWGYRVEDSGVLESLNPATIKGRKFQDRWIALRSEPDIAMRAYWKSLGFQIIVADTEELLNYLSEHVEELQKAPKSVITITASTETLFPQESIPRPGTVPVRPIIEFYLGAAPSWHDIFSGSLHRTDHFARIRESINADKNTVALGIPASGKTTLMMQLAYDVPYNGRKLVCDRMSKEKANLVKNKLNGDKAIIYIDNFADDVEGFALLQACKNIRLIGFDREYNYEIISHRVLRPLEVLDVTQISPPDVQEIMTRIPANIKRSIFKPPTMSKGMEPSIFEIIDDNIIDQRLRGRYDSTIRKLAEDEEQLDFLLLCCYVHKCHTPVSTDMLMAYFDNRNIEEIGILKNQLGSMIADEVDLADGTQDYYLPRSLIISESIIERVPREHLARMLTRFHNNVSSYRIHRYDIFRRRAYDADLMANAFHNWREGLKFYENVLERDSTPYLRQQGALYLAKMRRFDEAFQWIDEAMMQGGSRIFTIRNSHAVILFKANIDRDKDDQTVQRTLQNSMSIIAECYKDDRRKVYHAISYAEQAIKYYRKYVDQTALAYLSTAKKWLKEENIKEEWNRNIKRMIKEIDRLRLSL